MEYGPKCHSGGIRGYGNPDSKVVLLGIAPGRHEVEQGKPFVGKSGIAVNNMLSAVGWSREDVYCTNLICWWNDSPSDVEISACAPRLREELEWLKPKLVITLGKLVTESFTSLTFGIHRGIASLKDNYYVLPTYHPASAYYNPFTVNDIVRDLRKIPVILSWNGTEQECDYEVVRTAPRAQEVLYNLPDIPIAVDIETSNKDVELIDVFVDRLLCMSLSDGNKTWVFTRDACTGLDWPERHWIFHNAMFDTQGIKKYLNVALTAHDDTMLMSYIVDERSGYHKLKSLAREYCNSGFYEENIDRKNLDNVNETDLHLYNARDAMYTARLYPVLNKFVHDEHVEKPYTTLLMPAANAFSDIQLRGVAVDRMTVSELAVEWIPILLERDQELVEYAKKLGFEKDINTNSPKQLSHLLFDIVGLKGGPSTAKEVLETLDHPFVDKLQEYRKLHQIITHYIAPFPEFIREDGRVHANVLLHGTVTGRTAYRNPPLQTIPNVANAGEYAKFRRIFVATDDKYVIAEADYSRAEIYGAYICSGDPNLLDDLLSGDYHRRVASVVFHVPEDQVTSKQRLDAKAVTFGIMYNLKANSLAKDIKCTPKEAQELIDSWFARYPLYRKWWENIKKEAVRSSEIVSLTGRKRRFGMVSGDMAYRMINQAVNFPIQSLIGDYKLDSLIQLHSVLGWFDSYVLFDVHDELVFELSKDQLGNTIPIIKRIMEEPKFGTGVGIPIEMKLGPNWYDVKEIDLKEYAA